jgi:hypothetical protein
MKKNVAGQTIGAQLNSRADGSPVTSGTTTAYITGDGSTQLAGTVSSGACTHKGNGFWTYGPSSGETNYNHVAFTFVNSTAVNATVQIFTSWPQSTDNSADAFLDRDMSAGTDSGGRTVRNALRLLRNKVSSSGGVMTVTKEDDSTSAWTATLTTDPAAEAITVIDPA